MRFIPEEEPRLQLASIVFSLYNFYELLTLALNCVCIGEMSTFQGKPYNGCHALFANIDSLLI